MTASIASLALALSVASTGGLLDLLHNDGGFVTPPGPGLGWGFPNGNPDGHGYYDYGRTVPMGADRTPDYYFRRQYTMPATQIFYPTYYNHYISRGQRYIPYSNCGGWHPAGGPAPGPSNMPMYPSRGYNNALPSGSVPTFTGRTDAPPEPAGGSGLIP